MTRLKVNNVAKSFKENRVLNNISFHTDTGDILGVFGRNGSGKSTLLKILFGTLKADFFNGFIDSEIYEPAKNFDQRRIAYLPQDSFMPNDINVRNLIGLYHKGEEAQDRIFYDPRVAKVLNQRIATLSEGERKYIELLMVALLPNKFLLLDEPFVMVEPLYKDVIKELLITLKPTKGIVLTDHYYQDVLHVTTRNIVLHESEVKVINDKSDLIKYGYVK